MLDCRCLLGALALALGACAQDDGVAGDPDSPAPEFQRLVEDARYEMDRGDLSDAGRLFDEALAIDRNDAGLWVDIARLRFRGGEHLGAIEAADRALQLDSQFAPALLIRAQLVRDGHGLAAAIPWFETALLDHPDHESLLAEYAATLGDLGRHRDMLAVVRHLAEVNPRDPRVHFLQAVLAARAGDPIVASSLLKRSGMRDSGTPSAVLLGAIVDIQQGTSDNAVSELEGLLERQPGNVRVQEMLALSLWLSGRDRELLDRFATLANRSDTSPYLVMLVARSFERSGDRAKAALLIDRARAAQTPDLALLSEAVGDRRSLPPPTSIMRQFLGASDEAASATHAAVLVEKFPGSSDILVLAGDAAFARNAVDEALTLYGRAAKIRRPWPLTRKIIHAFRLQGDDDAADALLARHLEGEPRNTEALAMLAERSAAESDWLRAAILIDTAIALGAGNDPDLLALRRDVATALDNETEASKFAVALELLRPGPFASR